MLINNIETNKEITLDDFARFQSYRYNLELFIEDFKNENPYKYKKIKNLENELEQAKDNINQILNGKRNYSSIEYNSKMNKI